MSFSILPLYFGGQGQQIRSLGLGEHLATPIFVFLFRAHCLIPYDSKERCVSSIAAAMGSASAFNGTACLYTRLALFTGEAQNLAD